jgi:hypothetical protein
MGIRAAQITRTFARYSKADVCPPLLSELPRFNRSLLQPVGHAHFAVHCHRRGEVLLGLLLLALARAVLGLAHVPESSCDLQALYERHDRECLQNVNG